MRQRLLDLLACPSCGRPLSSGSGTLGCAAGHAFPVEGGVPVLFAERPNGRGEQVRRRFDYQWRRFGRAERLFGKKRGAMLENLANARIGSTIREGFYPGRTVLDAGCGHGRYVEAFARLGAETVGLDAADFVRDLGPDLGTRDRVHLVQGDVLRPPFREASFDLVFCDGVLHHTGDAGAAFRALARLVRPGGYLYVWLYPREGRAFETTHRVLRAATMRLPARAVAGISFALVPLLSVARTYSGTRLGRARWSECAQVVYDWLSPAHQSHHSPPEVRGWFEAEGFETIEDLPVPVGMIGQKSAASAAGGTP